MRTIANRYGHPNEEVLWRVNEFTDARVYGTDIHGTIVIETDGTDYRVKTESKGTLEVPKAACIDLNAASAGRLTELIHIGEVRAGAVTSMRPFDSLDDLIRVPGIGDARLEDIRDQGMVCPID